MHLSEPVACHDLLVRGEVYCWALPDVVIKKGSLYWSDHQECNVCMKISIVVKEGRYGFCSFVVLFWPEY